jgi:Zn-dependent M16 (insulinase) family peptidase
MISYRDPNLEKTLAVYDTVLEEFLEEEIDAEDLRTMIIGAMAKLDPPRDPGQKGRQAFRHALIGMTEADRRRFREAVLACDAQQLRAGVQEALLPKLALAPQSAYAPKARLEAANAALPAPFEIRSLD